MGEIARQAIWPSSQELFFDEFAHICHWREREPACFLLLNGVNLIFSINLPLQVMRCLFSNPMPSHSIRFSSVPSCGVTENLHPVRHSVNSREVFVCSVRGPVKTDDLPFARPMKMMSWSCKYSSTQAPCFKLLSSSSTASCATFSALFLISPRPVPPMIQPVSV